AVELAVFKIGVKLGEDLGDKHRVVGDVAGALVRDRNRGRIAADLHGAVENGVQRIARDDNGYRALRVVSDIEQRAVRRQGAASRLGAHLDCRSYSALHKVNDRDGPADAVGDVCSAIRWMHSDTARLFANANFGQLCGDIIAIRIFHLNDGDT